MWHICHNRGLADFAIMSNCCVCLCLQKLQTADKHKHSNIYVTVASRLLYLCAEVSLIQQTNYRNASKCDSIRWLAGCTKSPTELVLPGSVYNWFSIDQHKLFMNITPGEYSEGRAGRCCQRYVASVKTKCHNIKVVNVWERAEHSNETWDAEENKS